MSFEQKYLKYRRKYLELKRQIGGEDDEKDKLIEAVKLDGLALKSAPDNFKDDKEVVLEAVNQNGKALEFASDNLKDDKEVVMAAINKDAIAFKYASKKLKNDRDLVIFAVSKNGWVLRWLSNFNNDKEIVMLSLKNNGLILNLVSDNLKDDEVVVYEALTHLLKFDSGYERMFPLISSRLKNNKEFILKVLKFDAKYYNFLSDDLKNDKEIFLTACENIPDSNSLISIMPEDFGNDRDLMIKLINLNHEFFNKTSTELQNDIEFCKLSILTNCSVFKYFPNNMLINLSDKIDIVKKITIECNNLFYLSIVINHSPKMFNIDHYIEELVKKYGASYFNFAGDILKNDINFIKKICRINIRILYWIPDSVRDNEELFKGLWKISSLSLLYASKRLRILLEQQLRDHIRTNFANFTLENLFLQINHNITLVMYRNDDSLLPYLPKN